LPAKQQSHTQNDGNHVACPLRSVVPKNALHDPNMNFGLLPRVLAQQSRLRRHEHMGRPELERHQHKALERLRAFAYAKSRFYQRHHRDAMHRPLAELPVVTKAQLMEHFDDFVTDPRVHLADVRTHLAALRGDDKFLDRYWLSSTSGSTGLRGLFLCDRKEWVTVLASYARAMQWAGVGAGLLHRPRIGVVSSRVPWHQSARVGATLETRIAPVRRLDATDPLVDITEGLNQFDPEVLVAYASMTRVLAEEQLAGRLRVAPKAVMSASEVLTPDVRRLVARAFGAPPFNVYAATETAGIASECALHTGMHLYEDLVITEVVDEDNQPVPDGTFGAKILVTVLFSRTQPLIRYEMSDRVRLTSVPCACGRTFRMIDAVEGRSEEVLTFERSDGRAVAVHPNTFHAVLEPLATHGWQLIAEPGRLRLLAVDAPDLDTTALATALERVLGKRAVNLPIVVERVREIPRTALGKAPLIKRA
jgi:putative adenylate-forming enzyme